MQNAPRRTEGVLLLGYVTNGFAHHTVDDALRVLADLGYRSAAITLDHHHLNPFNDTWSREVKRVRRLLGELNMRCTIETGARFILDPVRKHFPNLMSHRAEDRERCIGFLCRAIDIAAELGADSVSLWSGAADDSAQDDVLFDRLRLGLDTTLEHAQRRNVRLSFEPEPGMYVERMADFERVCEAIDHSLFGLTLDIGHLHCLDDGDLATHLNRWRGRVFNMHIEDMKRGVHEHLPFGEGDMDFNEVFGALSASGYGGPIHVELSRHSHAAPSIAREAMAFLAALARPTNTESKI